MIWWNKDQRYENFHRPAKLRPLYRKSDLVPAFLVGFCTAIAVIILGAGIFSKTIVPFALEHWPWK